MKTALQVAEAERDGALILLRDAVEIMTPRQLDVLRDRAVTREMEKQL